MDIIFINNEYNMNIEYFLFFYGEWWKTAYLGEWDFNPHLYELF